MARLEEFVPRVKNSFQKWSQEYETRVQQVKQHLESDHNKSLRDDISTLNLLRCYSNTLRIYMDLQQQDAIEEMESYADFPEDDMKATPHEQDIKYRMKVLKDRLKQLPSTENPLLMNMMETLRDSFQEKPASRAILFICTKKYAYSMRNWVRKHPELQALKPDIITGHTHETGSGMMQVEQEEAVDRFRKGQTNLLIATSVAEEGLDVPECNLVIRFQHISNEIAQVQTEGRARAENSQMITMLSSDSKKQFRELKNIELNKLVEEILEYKQFPDGQDLKEALLMIQQDIITHRRMKGALKAKLRQSHTISDTIKLHCKKCKELACFGSEVYVLGTDVASNFYIVPNPAFEEKIITRDHPKPRDQAIYHVHTKHKIYCINCDQDWGVKCTWPSVGNVFPVIKCSAFTFEIEGTPRTIKKWKDVPFEIKPLSDWLHKNSLDGSYTPSSDAGSSLVSGPLSDRLEDHAESSLGENVPMNLGPLSERLEDHDAVLKEFVKKIQHKISKNEKISRKHAHSIFVGPTGAGKSSLMHRLLQRRKKLLPLSTGVCDPVVIVDVNCHSATAINPDTWVEVEYKLSILRQMNEECFPTLPAKQFKPNQSDEINSQPTDLLISQPTSTPEVARPREQVHPSQTEDNSATASSTLVHSDGEQTKMIMDLVEELGGPEQFWTYIEKGISLYLRDTGGQVEFQEMVALLVFGPSIFLFVFRLDVDFHSKFSVEYRLGENESINKYTSSVTTEEAFLQFLASVYAMDMPATAGVNFKPLVFIVGTHKDELGPSAGEKIATLNKHLDSLIVERGFDNLVEYAGSRGEVMFAVDNTSASDEDFKAIRSRVYHLISGREEFTVEYPFSYLLFCLELQNQKCSILSLDNFTAIAAKCGIVGDQVSHLLQFLHRRLGVIQYYDIDSLKHIVLKEPQVLFHKVTKLIVETFSCKAVRRKELKDFEKGILTASVFKAVVGTDDKITCQELLDLLVHLRIIAPYPSTAPGVQEERYFIPCVLNHVDEPSEEGLDTDILPLSIQFQCSHCPKGLFGVLVTHLMTPAESGERLSSCTTFTLKIFKDQISLEVQSYADQDEISLKVLPSHIEINFYPSLCDDRDSSVGEVCNNVRQVIDTSILRSLKDLRYNKLIVKPEVCFRCENCSKLHQVIKGKDYYKMFCKETRTSTRLPLQARFWYDEVSVVPPQMVSCKGSASSGFHASLTGTVSHCLDQQLSWDDLCEIARHMLDWEEKLCAPLGLTEVDVHDILKEDRKPELQRREALKRWTNYQGLNATYGNLLELFVKAGHSGCAKVVRDLLRRKN